MCNKGCLEVPECLTRAYAEELNERGLYAKMLSPNPQHLYGGETQELTEDHFAHRFLTSSARLLYCIYAPCKTFSQESNSLLTLFSHGKVALLDIPCGTGAASATLISALIELRQQNLLPCLPLTIFVHSGDFSEPSRAFCRSILRKLSVEASTVGITIQASDCHWNAHNDFDTSRMLDDWFLLSGDATEHVILLLNFSDELHTVQSFKAFEPAFRQIIGRLHNRQGVMLWLEPGYYSKAIDLSKHLTKLITNIQYLKELAKEQLKHDGAETATFIRHPLKQSVIPARVRRVFYFHYF